MKQRECYGTKQASPVSAICLGCRDFISCMKSTLKERPLMITPRGHARREQEFVTSVKELREFLKTYPEWVKRQDKHPIRSTA